MEIEAQGAGYYHSQDWNQAYSRVEVRTVEQLLRGEGFSQPPAGVGVCEGGESGDRGRTGEDDVRRGLYVLLTFTPV